MVVELVLLYVGLAAAGAFTASKAVDLYRISSSESTDKYSSCIEATKNPRDCRTLE